MTSGERGFVFEIEMWTQFEGTKKSTPSFFSMPAKRCMCPHVADCNGTCNGQDTTFCKFPPCSENAPALSCALLHGEYLLPSLWRARRPWRLWSCYRWCLRRAPQTIIMARRRVEGSHLTTACTSHMWILCKRRSTTASSAAAVPAAAQVAAPAAVPAAAAQVVHIRARTQCSTSSITAAERAGHALPSSELTCTGSARRTAFTRFTRISTRS